MRHRSALVIALVVLAAAFLPAPVLADSQAGPTVTHAPASAQVGTNQTTNGSVAPGTKLAGAVAVHQAELKGDVERRAYGIQVASAATNHSKGAVVATERRQLEARVNTLAATKAQLEAGHRNGSLSDAAYRVRASRLVAETATVRTLASETVRTSEGLPTDVLQANGVNVTAIRALRDHAADLPGQETSAIARTIAGDSVGTPVGPPFEVPRGDSPPGKSTNGDPTPGTDHPQSNDRQKQGDGTTATDMTPTLTETSSPPDVTVTTTTPLNSTTGKVTGNDGGTGPGSAGP